MKVSDTEYLYKIGNKEYRLKPLVMGQVNQLINLLKDVQIPADATIGTIVLILGERLTEAIAIILHTDVPLKDKNLQQVIEDLSFDLTPEQALEIVNDFFDCTPISSIFERIGKTVEKIGVKLNPTGLQNS